MPAIIPVAVTAILSQIPNISALAVALAGMAASLVAGLMQQAMMPSSKTLGTGLRGNTRSVKEPLKLVYGTCRVGGNDVFCEPAGTNNSTLHIVQTLAEGECDSIATDDDSNDLAYLNDKTVTEMADAGAEFSYEFYSGSATQTVDSDLNSAIPAWTDPMRHTCYIRWSIGFGPDHFGSIPKRTVVLKGRKLYDFRDGSTAYSANPVLELYDYLTDPEVGRGIDPARIDEDSWTEAANYCDTKGFECHVGFATESSQTIIDTILAHFRGGLVYFGGKYFMKYADLNYETSALTLDDEHISVDADGVPVIKVSQPPIFNKPDGLRVAYVDADRDYVEDEIVVGESEGVVDSFALPGVHDRETALILGNYELERRRLNRGIAGTFRGDAMQLDPWDIVTLNATNLGISGAQMRVISATIRSRYLVDWRQSGGF